jgi:hypothetical protein
VCSGRAQECSPSTQAKAAAAQVQRRKWKMARELSYVRLAVMYVFRLLGASKILQVLKTITLRAQRASMHWCFELDRNIDAFPIPSLSPPQSVLSSLNLCSASSNESAHTKNVLITSIECIFELRSICNKSTTVRKKMKVG